MNSAQNPAYDAGLEARFASAERHSRLVRLLRIAVPAVVVLAMAAIILTSIFSRVQWTIKLPIDSGNLAVSGTKITMESPHLSGYTPDQRPYELWATTATQDITDPDHVELSALRSKVLMQDQSTVTLESRTGIFDNKQQVLDLRNNIILRTTTGYEAYLSQAFVDIAKGTVTSDEHVDVKLTNGTLSSDRLRITDGGEVVRFEGNVVMHLENLNAAPRDQVPEAPAEPAQPAKAHHSSKSVNSK